MPNVPLRVTLVIPGEFNNGLEVVLQMIPRSIIALFPASSTSAPRMAEVESILRTEGLAMLTDFVPLIMMFKTVQRAAFPVPFPVEVY